ncbi:MAG: Rrf2 family transcriptional regulator, partial [Planctomycetes bacterium]|nr:Rrf2 family transcriptional regulator [Planctomycetota bacterium]
MLSLTAEYALRAMIYLAQHCDECPIPGRRIAAESQIPPNYLATVLGDLVRAGVLQGSPGKGGGFSLARRSRDIRLNEVLVSFEPILANRRPCPFGKEVCSDEDPCAAVRAAFPEFEALPGDQGTDLLLESAWPAIGVILGFVLGLFVNTLVLFDIAATVRGPRLANAMLRQIKAQNWTDWLDFADPQPPPQAPLRLLIELAASEGEINNNDGDDADANVEQAVKAFQDRQSKLRARHDTGELSDPLAPVFEMAVAAIEGRRYALVDQILTEIGRTTNAWLEQSAEEGLDTARAITAVIHHLNELVEVAVNSGADSQVEVIMRNTASMARTATERADGVAGIRLAGQIGSWSKRFAGTARDRLAAKGIHSIYELASARLDSQDMRAFEECSLVIARVGETVAQRHREKEPETLFVKVPEEEETSTDALINALSRLTGQFTSNGSELRGYVKMFADALLLPALAFWDAPIFDEQTDKVSSQFADDIGLIGLAAAKVLDGDALAIVGYHLQRLAVLNKKTVCPALRGSLARKAFEIGMIAEDNAGNYRGGMPPRGGDYPDIFAQRCSLAGIAAMRDTVPLFLRPGHTMR